MEHSFRDQCPTRCAAGLGLLPDPNLFADPTLLHNRLERNTNFMAALRNRTAGQMEAVRKRLNRDLDKARTGRNSAPC